MLGGAAIGTGRPLSPDRWSAAWSGPSWRTWASCSTGHLPWPSASRVSPPG